MNLPCGNSRKKKSENSHKTSENFLFIGQLVPIQVVQQEIQLLIAA